MNLTEVKAKVFPTSTSLVNRLRRENHLHLSQVTSPLIVSPTVPPELRYVTFRSVETPVEYKPREARASEPLVSTIVAIVAPCSMPSRLVCCFSMGSSKLTRPGIAAVILIWKCYSQLRSYHWFAFIMTMFRTGPFWDRMLLTPDSESSDLHH